MDLPTLDEAKTANASVAKLRDALVIAEIKTTVVEYQCGKIAQSDAMKRIEQVMDCITIR